MPGLGFGRKLSPTQLALLEAMAAGATLTAPSGGSGLLHHPEGPPAYVAFHTWQSLIRRGAVSWFRPDEMLPSTWSGLVGRITDAGRRELEAAR